ncbi:MAG: Holliday junction branch migration protein RuvA [Clostridiales bacterium]|jgi:Holliday junction DNA helicase RuvA|nr:Holliday junction branch migration protein RuvA [Clostridiales bacterium]
MVSFIKGFIDYIADSYFVIENNGVGYTVYASANTIRGIELNQEAKIYTYMNVTSDAITLFGFLTREEINIFDLLKTVQGVGPKIAVGILNTMPPEQIILSIITEDINAITKCPGIGKKTSQRIILELKDKMKTQSENILNKAAPISFLGQTEKQDAADALTSLGYGQSESFSAVMGVYTEGMDTSQIIKLSLKKLSRQ